MILFTSKIDISAQSYLNLPLTEFNTLVFETFITSISFIA